MKIIRVNNELHFAFKNMCKANKLTIQQGIEKLIKEALRRGSFNHVKKDVYTSIQELNNTFKAWMRKQEQTHLTQLSEDMLALARNLRNLGTKDDMRSAIKEVHQSISKTNTTNTLKYNAIIEEQKQQLSKHQKKIRLYQKYSFIGGGIVASLFLAIYFIGLFKKAPLEYKLIEMKYDYLYEYCQKIETSKNLDFMKSYKRQLDTVEPKMINYLKTKGHVYQGD
jgi:hypothetical protein